MSNQDDRRVNKILWSTVSKVGFGEKGDMTEF